MQRSKQISESIELGVLLALSGGLMDAYSYVCRGEVFANAQTGNILLFGVHLSTGNFSEAFRYFLPVLTFSVGIALAVSVREPFKYARKIHWRQITVLFEAVLLAMVAFIPQQYNLLANSLISFACGIQVESFRKINGNPIATTMCIGNLRSATQLACDSLFLKNREMGERGLLFYGVIVVFTLGAILGNLLVRAWQEKAILVSCLLLLVCFVMMFIDRDNE